MEALEVFIPQPYTYHLCNPIGLGLKLLTLALKEPPKIPL